MPRVPFSDPSRCISLLGFGTVVALGCFIFGWATFTEISGAVIASGKLAVDSNVKKVQHPTGGVVGDLMVKDGDHVKKGRRRGAP